jgi:hypothetical protein
VSFASADLEQSSPFSSSVPLLLSLFLLAIYSVGACVLLLRFFFGPCFLLFFGCFLVVAVGEVLGFELLLCVLSSFVAFSL